MPRFTASFAALALLLIAPVSALAEEAIVIRTSAPAIPVAMRLQAGQMVDLPKGAAVTLLFRDGRMTTLTSAAGARLRVEKPPASAATPASEALRAAIARPERYTVLGATRAPDVEAALEAMRRGAFPAGDFIAQFAAGCRTAACQALEVLADERTPLALHVRLAPPGEDGPIEVRVNRDAYVLCWRADASVAAGFDGTSPIARNVAHLGPADAALAGCAAHVAPLDAAELKSEAEAAMAKRAAEEPQAWAYAAP